MLLLLELNCMAQRPAPTPRLSAILNMQDSVALQDTLNYLLNSSNEKDVQLLVNYYNAKNNAEKSKEVQELELKHFPNGQAALNRMLDSLYNGRDPQQNEATYKSAVRRFGDNPEFNRRMDAAKYFTAITFLGKSKPDKVWEYLNMIQDPVYKPKAFSYAARESIAAHDSVLGLSLIRKTFAALKGDTTDPGYDEYCRIYSELLYKNKQYKEGFPYAKRVYYKHSKTTSVAFSNLEDTYLHYLVALKKYKEAYPLMEVHILDESADQQIKDHYKAAYIAEYGSEKGYSDTLAVLNKAQIEGSEENLKMKMVNTPAHDFELKDVDGKTVRLSDFKGKVVILDFWATWCSPCKRSFPAMQMAQNKYKNDPNVKFLFIHTWERDDNATAEAKAYVQDNHYNFEVLMDLKNPATGKNDVVSSYGVTGIPAKFIIDPKGNIRFQLSGFNGSNEQTVNEVSSMIEMARGKS